MPRGSWFGWLALLEFAGAGYELGHRDWFGFIGLLLAGTVFAWLRYQENPWLR